MPRLKEIILLGLLLLLTIGALTAVELIPGNAIRKLHAPPLSPETMYQHSRADSAHGFDVQKYEITLTINDNTHVINGNVLATVLAEENLSSITYELVGLTVSSVLVNGQAATFSHSNGLLTINMNIAAGQQFSTQVFYSGTPQLSPNIYHIGMIFGTNTVFTISDPDAGRYWWPCYDHPWDKAIVDLHITMRSDWKVAANGIRTGIVNNGNGTSTTHWIGENPMTTYLVCITAGPYVEINQTVPEVNNLLVQSFVTQNQYNNAIIDFQQVPSMLAFFSQIFGTYPFEKYGQASVNMSTYGAMEHQTMTTLGNFIITGTGAYELIIAHELAHQWYGDAVSFLDFKDVWLSEGFATYSEHLWVDKRFGWQAACDYVLASYHQYYLNWENGAGPQTIYNPSFNNYFAPPSYEKAASVLHMLRLKIGNANFFQLLQQWFITYKHLNAITAEFQDMAEQISGQNLSQFFSQWIYGSGIPSVQYSLWQCEDISRVKVKAKTTSPTATQFSVELPFRFTYSGVSDSLVVNASSQGSETEFLYAPNLDQVLVTANYHNWALLRNVTEIRPQLTGCMPSNGVVQLTWQPFESDNPFYGYFVYRKDAATPEWELLNWIPTFETSYLDNTVENGITYQYTIAVFDSQDSYLSVKSNIMQATPQAFSFANQLLVVDETRDGTGTNINPTDTMVDDFYYTAISPMAFDTWDCATQGLPSLDILGQYRLVLWHADDFSQNQLQGNLDNLGGYLLGGGKVLLSGWKTPSVLTPDFLERFAGGAGLTYDNGACLIHAESAQYPTLLVDPDKTTASWNNMLPFIYTFTGVQNSLYTAVMVNGSQGNGQSAALRFDDTGTLVLFGFPLYYMQATGVRTMLQQLLPQLNPGLPVGDEMVPVMPASLACYPNPFNPRTTVGFYLPQTGSVSVELYNIKGQKVLDLARGVMAAGNHSVLIDGNNGDGRALASGVYLLRFSHPGGEIRKRISLVK